jgi:hypothetical protein
MATFYHPNAKPGSLSGVAEVRGAGFSGLRLQTYDLEFTAAQLNTGDVIYLDKFDNDTVILGGWIQFDELDAHATATLDIDCGWDDGTTDDPDGFLNGGVISGGGPANVVLTTGVGTAVATFIPAAAWDFKLTVIAGAATAAAGGIKVCVLLADASSQNQAVVQ